MHISPLGSISECNGLKLLSSADLKIYSVGISTGGAAEIEMARSQKERSIIATTIDPVGAEYAQAWIQQSGLSNQVKVKIEDVSQPLPYPDNHFDYIYARLILHYLPKKALTSALKELYRILCTGKQLFVVVRSVECPEATSPSAKHDPETGFTTYFSLDLHKWHSRYFHSKESIQQNLKAAGFHVTHIDTYPERLCHDFERKCPASQATQLIEVLTIKYRNISLVGDSDT